jgi:hypothetical protein
MSLVCASLVYLLIAYLLFLPFALINNFLPNFLVLNTVTYNRIKGVEEREIPMVRLHLLASVDDTLFRNGRPRDIHKLSKALKLRKARGLEDIPNECFRHLTRRLMVQLIHLFNHCLRLSHFSKLWKDYVSGIPFVIIHS